MTREQKIAKARELGKQGLTFREIGEQMGLTLKQAYYYALVAEPIPCRICKGCGEKFEPQHGRQECCSDECTATADNERKRRWERENRAECPKCGQPMGAGSASPSHTPKRCTNCKVDEARARTAHFIRLRQEGLTNKEIGEREGLSFNTVANTLCRAHRYGLEVPPPPHWSRGKAAA